MTANGFLSLLSLPDRYMFAGGRAVQRMKEVRQQKEVGWLA